MTRYRYSPSFFGQDGWILARFFFIIPIAFALTMNEQAWSIYGLYGQPKGERFRAGLTREIPCEQDGPISPARVANQNAEFDSSCPLADSATGS